jgi:hypothetical protein
MRDHSSELILEFRIGQRNWLSRSSRRSVMIAIFSQAQNPTLLAPAALAARGCREHERRL